MRGAGLELGVPGEGLSGVGEFDTENDGGNAESDREGDLEEGEVGEARGPEGVGIFGEGREGGEAAEEAGGEEREDPWRGGLVGEVSKKTTDEEAAENVAGENADRKAMETGFSSNGLDAGGKAVAGQGSESSAEENEECVHGCYFRTERRASTLSKSLMPGEISAPEATSRAAG